MILPREIGLMNYIMFYGLTTITGEIPYMLRFGIEAMVTTEIGLPTHMVLNFNSPMSDLMRRLNLDMLEEVREDAALRNAAYQHMTACFNKKRFNPTNLKEGNYALNKVIQKSNKLEANWHGPYCILAVIRPGTYRIVTLEEEEFKNPWNVEHLLKYYQ